ncbi:protein ROOT INITIATION DEFECTIVE 3 [Abeliophyllum distichum]|uniref:Protein ROOT INITIATION DEFECTIVE 3 n=1 Tax=Abeliophyllum distichum TaxID=126358 RepID=A0ABD1SU53_9LAMI
MENLIKELQKQGSSAAAELDVERLKVEQQSSVQTIQQWKTIYENLHQFCVSELLDGFCHFIIFLNRPAAANLITTTAPPWRQRRSCQTQSAPAVRTIAGFITTARLSPQVSQSNPKKWNQILQFLKGRFFYRALGMRWADRYGKEVKRPMRMAAERQMKRF